MLSFKGDEVECKVVSVYDGDTIKVVFPLGGHMYKMELQDIWCGYAGIAYKMSYGKKVGI